MNLEKNKIPVSVIIPVYNVENFLVETIESVLTQSLPEIELILVNDGSTDGSAVICESYQQKDSRIKYFSQNNSGVSVARNLGLSHATGEFIFFLDSDDTIDADFLKTSYEVAKQNDSDIVIVGEYFYKRMPNVMALPTCAQFIRLEFLKKYPDIKFPENIQPGEDGLFSHQLLALTRKISLNAQGIYNYRKHENQNHVKINENAGKVLDTIPKWFGILEDFYTKHQLFKSHALHLALFIEHEPFEFRYIAMSLNDQQKIFLHTIIKEFMNKNVFPYFEKKDKKHLSGAFLYFLETDDCTKFDAFYPQYLVEREKKRKLYLKLIKFIPIKSIRKQLRSDIVKNFER
ncbi:glycosyltransferase family 2 protein [Chryseobacterium sp. PMSZPI]|uniref:glycosyltransferase family 2 protein n=1 Tax=Chryseobacterium sp. PMSZPI TaxID=1033900 RepID=UPI000C34AE8F|nr:glycosyltransferase family 2 protein [Chryseobacterium sp. PMSZPI]PKF74733.1 glycosyl transferase family 2 [Chryseobacterium sp. PMSZPI]